MTEFEAWRRRLLGRDRLAMENGRTDERITPLPCPPGRLAIERMTRAEMVVADCHDSRCHVRMPHPAHAAITAR